MRIKPGADVRGLQLEMRPVLVAADRIWKEHGHELVVTSGLDGLHSAGSLHYYGFALDLRTRYFKDYEEKRGVFLELYQTLKEISKWYDVVLEPDHIHVEYDIIRMRDYERNIK